MSKGVSGLSAKVGDVVFGVLVRMRIRKLIYRRLVAESRKGELFSGTISVTRCESGGRALDGLRAGLIFQDVSRSSLTRNPRFGPYTSSSAL